MSDWVEVFAPAKINLTLHVTGQRKDGYHLLDSLVVFAGIGDTVRLKSADTMSLRIIGPMAQGVPADESNLVWRAIKSHGICAEIELYKRLPAASGIGGGSSDAAAALRGAAELTGTELERPSHYARLGADVPVCLYAQHCRMTGIGDVVSPVAGLPSFHLVLVNPLREVATQAVFQGLSQKSGKAMPDELPEWNDAPDFAKWLETQRNDLELPARSICPAVGVVLSRLTQTEGCLLARMSGSGATCFGMYATSVEAKHAQQSLAQAHPDWWVS